MGRHAVGAAPQPGRRASAPVRRRRRLWIPLVLIVACLVAAGVTWRVLSQDGADCSSRTTVTVAADPSMTTPLKAVTPSVSAASCYDYTVTAVAGAAVAGQLGRGSTAPDLWVADSSERAATVLGQVRLPVDPVGSLASSPAVVVGRNLSTLRSWVDVMRLPGLRIGSPITTSTGNAPIAGAVAAVEKGTLTSKQLTDAMTVLAIQQGNIRAEDDSEENRLALADSAGSPTVTSEQQFVDYRRAHPGTALTAAVPTDGTVFLDHPMLVTAGVGERDTARDGGRRLAAAMSSPEGLAALRDAGFRPSSAEPLPGAGVGRVPAVVVTDTAAREKTLRQWAVVAEPIRTLVALDVSGSMSESVGDTTRADLLVQAALAGNKLFPNNTEIGLWFFSTDKGGPGQDWTEIAPIEREDARRPDGRTQREYLDSRAEDYEQYIGGGTGLYDTTLAAYRKVLDSYDPSYSNSIIVLTDGRNDDPDSISLDELTRRIRQLADPARPVEIVTIGISDDVDTQALKQISALSPGGTSYVAREPGDIANVLVNAVAARVTAAGR
ncbi:substrate-binding domain-containing protein [Williamsia deligens]|uniref:Substrate-binding domain-containing protein n=1 Tax=Williamsia deligens TaxID=321325 RepID=A0ABW3G8S5_9NOCA|nr:substrate-binding domain-containing protein [Williamsia deligens]MCP2192675.1 von Willebrand factor type A domain-containing protein [Williamsia deligens]